MATSPHAWLCQHIVNNTQDAIIFADSRGEQGGIPVLGVTSGGVKTDYRVVAPIDSSHDGAGSAVIDAEQHGILLSLVPWDDLGCVPLTLSAACPGAHAGAGPLACSAGKSQRSEERCARAAHMSSLSHRKSRARALHLTHHGCQPSHHGRPLRDQPEKSLLWVHVPRGGRWVATRPVAQVFPVQRRK